ncbi:lipopolysaccharide biosynthesis protein [Bariatricus sp. SGI.154]|uniref:lipopolysaccharide biosynthesis protein n=1 Tax=Bariatricus sp. SGI.154 TaxID=3420549 RepID=UPI003D09063F
MINRLWKIDKKDIEKQSVFWNMMSSGLNSIVSMLLLWVVTLVNGVSDAGVFSLGFSTSQMMLTIGNYGMRNYQATDIKNKYSMRIYLASRIVTNFIMMLSVFAFVKIEGYFVEKAVITILLCLLKVTDAFDDVYGGHYQKQGRLDISGKVMSLRIVAYVIAFCASLLLSHNLIIGCLGAIVISSLVLWGVVTSTKDVIVLEKPRFDWKKIFSLLVECFPLCVSAFLLIYMGNAPKYAIDTYLSLNDQAYYTYLFMPCFVTNLFVGFALQPLLVKLSKSWLHKEYRNFLKLCGLIFLGAVVMATFIVVLGGAIGCQVLSIVFGVQLIQYRNVLIVLLIGGAFFAFAVIEQVVLTVMRRQIYLLIGFVIASITAFFISKPLVEIFELLGAGYAYTVSAGVLFLVLAIMIFVFLIRERKRNGCLD